MNTTATLPAPVPFAPQRPSRVTALAPALPVPTAVFPPEGGLGPADPAVTLSVVVPFYNPGDALAPTVRRIVEVLDAAGHPFEVVAVSDGSTDGSERTVRGLHPAVRVEVLPRNRGKGAALRHGFARTRGAWVAFIDADGDIDPRFLADYLDAALRGNHPVVYADKRHRASHNPSTASRRVISWTYSTLVTGLFRLEARDTQTGCKVFRRDVLADVLPLLREEGFALDLELFVALKAAGHTGTCGLPVALSERQAGSTVGRAAITRTLRDTLRILRRCRVEGAYAPAPAPGPEPRVADVLAFPTRTVRPAAAAAATGRAA